MEADPGTKPSKKITENDKKETSNTLSTGGDVAQPTRIRRGTIDIDKINRFLIESQFSFVFPCTVFLWAVFLLFGK